MANAHIPKHGFSSLGCDGRKFAMRFINPCGVLQRVAKRLNLRNHTGLPRFRFRRLMVASIVVLARNCAYSSSEFEVEGRLVVAVKSKPTDTSNATSENQNFDFLVRVQGSNWFIRIDDQSAVQGDRSSAWRVELASVGGDIFNVKHFTDSTLKTLPNGSTNQMHGSVRRQIFPEQGNTMQRVIWLAYCSSAYLATNKNVPPLRDFHGPSDDQGTTSILFKSSGLPIELKQKTPYLVGYSKTKAVKVKLPAPFENGFFDFEYRVSRSTNIDAIEIPAKFDAEFFLIERRADPPYRYTTTLMTGIVTKLRTILSGKLEPEFINEANIYDYRFTNAVGFPLAYVEKQGGKWIEKASPQLKDVLVSKNMIARKPNKSHDGQSKVWIIILLVALTAVPAASLAAKRIFRNVNTSPATSANKQNKNKL